MSDVPHECALLAAELRALREKCGLTLAGLAEESGYSKSSWQRYLSGQALPPWLAVRALGVLAWASEPRLRVLWDLADSAWSGRNVVEPARTLPEPAPSEETGPNSLNAESDDGQNARAARATLVGRWSRSGRSRIWLTAGLAVLCAAITAAVRLEAAGNDAATAGPAVFRVGCTGTACDGQDPQTTLCGVEPQTLLDQQTPQGAGVEIRYNPLCKAVWARAWNTHLGETLSLDDAGGPAQTVVISYTRDLDQFVYTPLLGLPNGGGSSPLKVCLKDDTGGAAECYTAKAP
jgi:transcriptional regulator with XRE-family HTH domain